jgi:hypothetical protein
MIDEISPDLAAFGVERLHSPLFDYGKIHASQPEFRVVAPGSIPETQRLVQLAAKEGVGLRTRGSGHTFSGATLPRHGEILIRTHRLRHFRFNVDGTLTAGAGAMVWDIRDLARDHGLDLPVFNGGWAGPTLGGYISAGGFGKSGLSNVHGGLWENIDEITVVDGRGGLRRVGREDAAFPWMFGSYGQLGCMVEAKLRLIPWEGARSQNSPAGLSGEIPFRQTEDPAVNDLPAMDRQSNLFWFSVLVDPAAEQSAWNDLARLVKRHYPLLRPDGGWAGPVLAGQPIGYHYVIEFKSFNPPLVYPKQATFIVMGVMSFLECGRPASNRRILEVERDFIEFTLQGGHRLYLQAENIGRTVNLPEYYGTEIWQTFAQHRHEFDPGKIFNRGIEFDE